MVMSFAGQIYDFPRKGYFNIDNLLTFPVAPHLSYHLHICKMEVEIQNQYSNILQYLLYWLMTTFVPISGNTLVTHSHHYWFDLIRVGRCVLY